MYVFSHLHNPQVVRFGNTCKFTPLLIQSTLELEPTQFNLTALKKWQLSYSSLGPPMVISHNSWPMREHYRESLMRIYIYALCSISSQTKETVFQNKQK